MDDYKKELYELLEEAVVKDATDLHLSSGRPPTLRIDTKLVPLEQRGVLTAEHAKNLAFSLLTDTQKEKFFAFKDLDFSFAYEEKARFRVNVFQQLGQVSAALRVIPVKIRTIEELNLPEAVRQFAKVSQGFFLAVGPAGHGKSAVLAALISEINNTRYDHIMTIEDPIEYIVPQDKCIIDQREVGVDVLDFHRGLRSMLREDIDIAMVGEMRDSETISSAMTAAETGHLIFSTLHTNTAAQTIDRIIDSFPPHQQEQVRSQLSAILIGILSRRLIPCKKGGIINAVELLIVNSAVRNLIREGKTHQIDMVIETSSEEGMISLNRSLADLVLRDQITYEDAASHSTNLTELKMLLQHHFE